MKRLLPLLLLNLIVAAPHNLFAKEVTATTEKIAPKQEVVKEEASKELTAEDIKLLSQAYGHMLGENLVAIGLPLDNTELIHGIQDAFNGAESPLDDTQTIAMITTLQENKFKTECKTNLKEAEDFLATNSADKDVVVLEKNKLQFKQIQKGTGKECGEADTPIITYKGSYLNGEVFGASDTEEPIALKDTIEGFRKAIIGMKVGEKRTVYIHPELGYGTSSTLSPNALLTFEIALQGIEKVVEKEEDPSIGGMGTLPNEDAFADTATDHANLK